MIGKNEIIESKKELHLIEILLPFLQLFSQYKLGVLNIGTIFLLIIAGLLINKGSGKIRFPVCFKSYLVFLGYVVIRDMLRIALGPDLILVQINRMVEYVVLYFLVFVVCSQQFDEDRLYKIWKIAGVIFTLGLLYHIVQIYVLGQAITPISIIPGYVLRPEESVAQLRPSSFFAEPASFVTAMLPLEFLSLKYKDFKWAIFSTISILLSSSTVGVILSIILWTVAFMGKNISFKRRAATLLVAAVVIGLFLNLDVFDFSLSKFLLVVSGENTFGSRVLIGFEVLRRQSALSFIFGTNYNEIANFVTNNLSEFGDSQIVIKYWSNERLFLNTFSRLIFQYGVIGLALFLSPLIKYLRQKEYAAKSLVIMTLVAIFGQTMLLNTYYFMLIMIFMLYDKKLQSNHGE